MNSFVSQIVIEVFAVSFHEMIIFKTVGNKVILVISPYVTLIDSASHMTHGYIAS